MVRCYVMYIKWSDFASCARKNNAHGSNVGGKNEWQIWEDHAAWDIIVMCTVYFRRVKAPSVLGSFHSTEIGSYLPGYRLCVTNVIILFHIHELEAFAHILSVERLKISYFLTELWSRENRQPQNLSQFFTISDIFFDFKGLYMPDKGSYTHPIFRATWYNLWGFKFWFWAIYVHLYSLIKHLSRHSEHFFCLKIRSHKFHYCFINNE